MLDVTKFIANPAINDLGLLERLEDLCEWNPTLADARALAEGIMLTQAHWDVIHFLRAHYVENGRSTNARRLTAVLDNEFRMHGGRRYLYRLFPQGPVAQGGRLAGLAVPKDSQEPSFGSVQ